MKSKLDWEIKSHLDSDGNYDMQLRLSLSLLAGYQRKAMDIQTALADAKARNKCLAIRNLPEHTTDRLATMTGCYPIS